MNIHPICTKSDDAAAPRGVSALFNAPPALGTGDADRFESLLALVGAYEAKHHAVRLPDPIEAIRFRKDHASLTVRTWCCPLVSLIGSYEVLKRKRGLTDAMTCNLHQNLGIPVESRIGP